MREVWPSLGATTQDALILLVLLVPVIAAGLLVGRGFAPIRIVRAVLWRFRWVNLVFIALIAVSVGIGIGLLVQERGIRIGTAEAADKFDLVITAPGSELTMLFAAVYLEPTAVPLLDGETFDAVASHERVRLAAPLAFGDSHEGMPIVGTTADFVLHLSDGRIDGRNFEVSDEAVVGASVPLRLEDRFEPAHRIGEDAEEGVHEEEITVVGRMARTGSPWDRAIMVPVESVWEAHGLASGHAPDANSDRHGHAEIGPPFDPEHFPGTPAIVVKADSLAATYAIRSQFDQRADTMAFFPGTVLSRLYLVMGDVRHAMSLLATVSQALVAASVLLGLFILTRLLQRQLALLRALGAPARFVCAVVWFYAITLLAIGAVLGIAVGYLASRVLSAIVTERTEILVRATLGWPEIHLVAAFVCLSALLAFVPAVVVGASEKPGAVHTRPLARLRQLGPLTDDNLLIFRDRTPKGRHYTERPGAPPTRLQDSSFGAGCFGNAKSS